MRTEPYGSSRFLGQDHQYSRTLSSGRGNWLTTPFGSDPKANRFGNGIDLRGMMHTIRGTWAQVEVAAAGGCGEVMLCGMFIGKEVF